VFRSLTGPWVPPELVRHAEQPDEEPCVLALTLHFQDPGKVWKGKRMPGRMGGDPIIVRNLVVWRIDPSVNAIAVRGSVPGGELMPYFLPD
jgi:hypothetical protein